jgi:hypothetical protein
MGYQSLTLVAVLAVASLSGPQAGAPKTYADFISLSREARQAAFATLTPDQKSAFKREHVRRWLISHVDSLSAAQVSIVHEALEFLSPAYYANPTTPERRRQEEALRRKLECSLGRSGVAEALTFDEQLSGQSWTEWADEWISWFKRCPVSR